MPQTFGQCEICKNEWYTLTACLKVRRPTYIPTCPEGAIMAVCDDCFATSSSDKIIVAAIRAYKKSEEWNVVDRPKEGVAHVHMTPFEHLLVEVSIKAWVRHMKLKTTESPFEQGALSI